MKTNLRRGNKSSFKLENGASIQPAIEELERVYSSAVSRFGGLAATAPPRIVIQTTGRKRRRGWFEPGRWRKTGTDDAIDEITIAAEYLARSVEETTATLFHEMVHRMNRHAGIQDAGKDGRYHNRKFKDACGPLVLS